jgi:hypothetical protein
MVKYGRDNALALMMGSSRELVDTSSGTASVRTFPNYRRPWTATPCCRCVRTRAGTVALNKIPAAVGVHAEFGHFEPLVKCTSRFSGRVRSTAAVPGRVGEGGLRIAAVTEDRIQYPSDIDKRQNVPCVCANAHANQQVYLNLSKDRRSASRLPRHRVWRSWKSMVPPSSATTTGGERALRRFLCTCGRTARPV